MLLSSVERLKFLNDKIRRVQLKNNETNAKIDEKKEFDARENLEEIEVVKVVLELME